MSKLTAEEREKQFWSNFNKYLPNPITGDLAGFEKWHKDWLESLLANQRQAILDEVEQAIDKGVPIFFTKEQLAKAGGDPEEIGEGVQYHLDLQRKNIKATLTKMGKL